MHSCALAYVEIEDNKGHTYRILARLCPHIPGLQRKMKSASVQQETEIVHLLQLQTLHELGIFFPVFSKGSRGKGGVDRPT